MVTKSIEFQFTCPKLTILDLFYGYIFSFDAVLNMLETEQVVVSALLGIDCPEQAKNHMLGILANGGRDEDLIFIRDIVSRVAERGHVHLRRVSRFETPRRGS
jgi:hypothetical protein